MTDTDTNQKAKLEAIQRYTDLVEARMSVAREFGRRIEARIQQAHNERQQSIGGDDAIKQAIESCWKSVSESVNKDVREGLLDAMPTTPLELAEVVHRYLNRIHGALDNLRTRYTAIKIQSDGKSHELDRLMGEARKICDEDTKKLQNFKEALDRGDIQFEVEDGQAMPFYQGEGERPAGIRPAGNAAVADLQERREAARKEKEAKASGQKKPPKKAPVKRKKDVPDS